MMRTLCILAAVCVLGSMVKGGLAQPDKVPVCGTYTIKAGDTLQRMSEDMYFFTKESPAANPTVSPDKLPLGQKVGIPCRLSQYGGTGIARAKVMDPKSPPPRPPPAAKAPTGTDKATASTDKAASTDMATAAPKAPASTDKVEVCGTYTIIKPGDTLEGISEDMYFHIEEFLAANPNVTPDKLPDGQKVNIPCRLTNMGGTFLARAMFMDPESPPPGPPPAAPKAPASTDKVEVCGTYTIKAGDILRRISAYMSFDVKEFLAANPSATPDKLPVGQKVKIPCPLKVMYMDDLEHDPELAS